MAAVERAKKALWALLRSYNAQRCAKLTVSTEKGKLKVILVENFDKHTNSVPRAPGRSVQASFAAMRGELLILL